MITHLALSPQLDALWRDRIERQLNLTLASVHWQIKRLSLVLDAVESAGEPDGRPSSQSATHHCRLEAKLRSGRSHVLVASNRDPQACVSDVAARLRREIVRDKQLGLLGKAG
jgi:hypothetical protein